MYTGGLQQGKQGLPTRGRRRAFGIAVATTVILVAAFDTSASAQKGPLPGQSCAGQPVVLLDTSNAAAVTNGPAGNAPVLDLVSPACITEITDTHWNDGRGAAPGKIGFMQPNERRPKLFPATGTSGQNGARNVNWVVTLRPAVGLGAGMYLVDDSDRKTWSQNNQSNSVFFTVVRGVCSPPAQGDSCVRKKS